MFISFWTFKTTSLGGLNAAASQAMGIYNRLSDGEANAGLWALGGSGVGHYGFHLTTATGAKNAALRNSFKNDPGGRHGMLPSLVCLNSPVTISSAMP